MASLAFRFYQIQSPLGELMTPPPHSSRRLCRLAIMSTIKTGVYRWAKFGWNLLLRLLCCTMRHRTVIWKHNVIYKTGNTLRIATPPEENRRARAICSMHKKLGKFGRVVFELFKQTEKRTTKQTYSSEYFAPLRFYGTPCVFLSRDETR